jgi:PAS domain-containing protein
MAMVVPQSLAQFIDIIIDSYFIIDMEHNIVDFNRAFVAMLPRAVARNLKTKKCHEVLQLDICQENCIAKQCWKLGRQVRLDEITGRVPGEAQDLRFILSAIPIRDENGNVIGALEVQRNVTDEALVQIKYQTQMEASTRKQAEAEETLRQRTRRLLEVSRRLYRAQRELLKGKTELFG